MFRKYVKKNFVEMRQYIRGEDLTGVSVSERDDPPTDMGMIARDPISPSDRWYVSRKYFVENYVLMEE